ncbi:hypothetical protein ATCC90586_007164 [Pythium insidiosum]|nr:hypothetical protein ATCC90586_007164 [Pythium insidiosum]
MARCATSLAPLLVIVTLVLGSIESVTAGVFRALEASSSSAFQWVEDPHAADPCTSPGCVNHVKYGYNVVPRNVSSDAKIVFQEAQRPQRLAAVFNLDIYTQPGCVVSACTMKKVALFFPKEDCFNAFAEKTANQPDGVTVLLKYGGMYYEHLPEGELYAKFERQNRLTQQRTCTYEVRSGFKRWI